MKKALILIVLLTYFVGIPAIFGSASAKTVNPSKKTLSSKNFKKPTPKIVIKKGFKSFKYIPYIFASTKIVNCAMPDGKSMKVKKSECDAVTAFWASHRPSTPSSNSGGGSSNNNNSGSSNNSNNNNNSAPVIGTPTVTSVTVMPCTSSSCHGITTIKVLGTGFTAATRLELTGSGVDGNYVGGDYVTVVLTDFINLPKGTYTAKIYSYNGDIHEVISSITIN